MNKPQIDGAKATIICQEWCKRVTWHEWDSVAEEWVCQECYWWDAESGKGTGRAYSLHDIAAVNRR